VDGDTADVIPNSARSRRCGARLRRRARAPAAGRRSLARNGSRAPGRGTGV